MDGRTCRLRAAALLAFTASFGCTTTGGTKPALQSGVDLAAFQKNNKPPSDAPNPSLARAKSTITDTGKPEPPKAGTFCAVAAVRDQMAENPELAFAEAEQLRSQARQAYQQALLLDPKHTPAYIGLAKSFAAIEDGEQAAKMFSKALEISPRDANLWYEKGMMQARFKDWDGAVLSLRQAQKIDPDNRVYSRTIGLALARAGRFDESLVALAKCMREEEARYTLARMFVHLEKPEAARDQLALAIRAHPTYSPARELMMEIDRGPANGVRPVGYQQPQANSWQDGLAAK